MEETVLMWSINGHKNHTWDPRKLARSALSVRNKAELLHGILEAIQGCHGVASKVKWSALQKVVRFHLMWQWHSELQVKSSLIKQKSWSLGPLWISAKVVTVLVIVVCSRGRLLMTLNIWAPSRVGGQRKALFGVASASHLSPDVDHRLNLGLLI